MNKVQLREAKAKLSALVEAAERGETTIVTKNGRPAARIAPIEGAQVTEQPPGPSFADWLFSMPHDLPLRRSRSRPRKVKF
jgi:prevent-host-death family protein